MKCTVLIFLIVFTGLQALAQTDSTHAPVEISGYAEVYYCYDFSKPDNHQRPDFIYSFNRHNEFNLNLGYIKARYDKGGVRSALALMAGTYAQYNLAAEHPLFQHLFEATIGVKIQKSENLWLDAGIMPSHIGFESAIGKDCWNLTRSIMADNSPYFETGVKLGYTSKNEKLYLAGLLLNGWQCIQRVPGNQTPAFGTQLTYKPVSHFTLNWSTFAGNVFPDSTQKWRYFNNFYGIFQLTGSFGITTGFDVGMQQKSSHSTDYDIWYAPVVILRVSLAKKLHLAARAEYYYDKDQVVISTGTTNGFQTFGYSSNLDVQIRNNFTWRIEGRIFFSHDKIFMENSVPSNNNYTITTSFAVKF